MGTVTTWRQTTPVAYKIMSTSGYVWNLAAATIDGPLRVFERFVTLPMNWRPSHSKCVEPTRAYLQERGALPWVYVLHEWRNWIKSLDSTSVVLVSHGNFRKERCVLQKQHWGLPRTVRLADSLYWRRRYQQSKRNSLKAWHLQQFGLPIEAPWLAVAHVFALRALLLSCRDIYYDAAITTYPIRSTPLVAVPGIGVGNEALILDTNVRSVEDLWLRRTSGLQTFLTDVAHVSRDDALRIVAWVSLSFQP